MNIALFSDSYLPTKSGVVTVVVQLKKVLEEMGHHVVVVTVGSNKNDETDDEDVFRVLSIQSPLGDGQYIGIPFRQEIREFLLKNKVEIIHAHTEFFIGHVAVTIGKELDIPVIATTHTMWEDYYKYYLFLGELIPRKVIRKAVQTLYKKFYAFINVSEKAHNYFNRPKMLPNIPSAIIPNAIDKKKFITKTYTDEDKLAIKQSLGCSASDKIVIYVGRVVEEKRLDELYEIASCVVNKRESVKFLIVGDGGRYEPLLAKAEADGLKDRILFTGFVDWEKLSSYYAVGDIFVTVSLSEMHSMTILEALSLGIPVVCRFDTSFSDTVFDGVDGYFGKNDQEVAEKILALLNDDEKRALMSENALKISDRFTLLNHGKRTVAFYKEILKHYPDAVTSRELQSAVDCALTDGSI